MKSTLKPVLNYQSDSLCFGEKSIRLESLAKDWRGPLYVYDLGTIRERARWMKSAFRSVQAYYAMKANSHPRVLQTLAAESYGADVVSGGEIQRALECGFSPKQIIYSGVGKTLAEIELALQVGIRQINVESLPELERISKVAKRLGKQAPVVFRLNPDIAIETHPYIATGLAENKFGIESGLWGEILSRLSREKDSLRPLGLSLHLGSQMNEFESLREALKKLIPFWKEGASVSPDFRVFDAGGGLGVDYEKENPEAELELLQNYANTIESCLKDLPAETQIEPGRWLVARAGLLLTQVQYVKRNSHRQFVIVDSGMNHLIRPALYSAWHRIFPLRQDPNAKLEKFDVVGPICESADFFAKERLLPCPQEGDIWALADAGAYGASMANTYNLQALPQEICLD